MFLDRFVAGPWRERISAYIYGSKGATLRQFDVSIMTALVETLSKPKDLEHLSPKRVFVYSLTISSLVLTLKLSEDANSSDGLSMHLVASTAQTYLLWSILSYPFDYLAIYFSKTLFFYKPAPIYMLPLRIVGNSILSLCGPYLVLIVAARFQDYYIWFGGAYITVVGALAVTLIQVVCLVGGALLRIVTRIRSKAGDDDSVLELRKQPFTSIFAAIALLVVTVDGLRQLFLP